VSGISAEKSKIHRLSELFLVSLKLGLFSFGGPSAHIGYFHNEYVKKKRWLDEKAFADLVALCQFLPGPASSQVGMGIGMMRAGVIGGLASFLGFTLPSSILLVLFAIFLKGLDISSQGWLHGLKIVAVVIVLQAVLDMGRKLANQKITATIALLSAAAVLIWNQSSVQILVILIASGFGWWFLKKKPDNMVTAFSIDINRKTSIIALFLFFLLLALLPLLSFYNGSVSLQLFDKFFRSGALVFGGGHVVLPLLEKEFVPQGWLSKESFLAGYAAAQAVPGPLFTFSSYLGAAIGGWKAALTATIAIFLPAFLLIAGTLPFWEKLRQKPAVSGMLAGVNAAVVGILLAALYNPIFTSAIQSGKEFAIGCILFGVSSYWKASPWMIVLLGAAAGYLFL
jgi:chromate transporter